MSSEFIKAWAQNKLPRLQDEAKARGGLTTNNLIQTLIGGEDYNTGFNSLAELIDNETAIFAALKSVGLTKTGELYNFPHKRASKKKAKKKKGAKA